MSILFNMCFKFVISLKLRAHTHTSHITNQFHIYTILCNGPEHTLEDIIVDNDMKKTQTIEIAIEWNGQD